MKTHNGVNDLDISNSSKRRLEIKSIFPSAYKLQITQNVFTAHMMDHEMKVCH